MKKTYLVLCLIDILGLTGCQNSEFSCSSKTAQESVFSLIRDKAIQNTQSIKSDFPYLNGINAEKMKEQIPTIEMSMEDSATTKSDSTGSGNLECRAKLRIKVPENIMSDINAFTTNDDSVQSWTLDNIANNNDLISAGNATLTRVIDFNILKSDSGDKIYAEMRKTQDLNQISNAVARIAAVPAIKPAYEEFKKQKEAEEADRRNRLNLALESEKIAKQRMINLWKELPLETRQVNSQRWKSILSTADSQCRINNRDASNPKEDEIARHECLARTYNSIADNLYNAMNSSY